MKYEVIEIKTGSRMSHTLTGQTMGTTLFSSVDEAQIWMGTRQPALTEKTHKAEPAK